MKKKTKLFCIALVAAIGFSMTACISVSNGKPLAFDESLPADEVALIHYPFSGVYIVGYNGIQVNWKPQMFSGLDLSIPGGDTQFILNGTTGTSNMGYTTYQNVPFTYNFEKGKEYSFMINQYLIWIYSGKTLSGKNLLAKFNMRNGQTLVK